MQTIFALIVQSVCSCKFYYFVHNLNIYISGQGSFQNIYYFEIDKYKSNINAYICENYIVSSMKGIASSKQFVLFPLETLLFEIFSLVITHPFFNV